MAPKDCTRRISAGWLWLSALAFSGLAYAEPTPTPADLYGPLYESVQLQHCYADSKTFADATATAPVATILKEYRAQAPADCRALQDFVAGHFVLPEPAATPAAATQKKALRQHIAELWPLLMRAPVAAQTGSSQLDVDFRHVVPGGRFREIYYWDTYFTLLGLRLDGHEDIVQSMVEGFAGLIQRHGHMPNGTRSYYLSRSQPPFFYLMVGLLDPQNPAQAYARQLPALRAEHAFWMAGADGLKTGQAQRRVVRMTDGSLLNRYWDDRDTPRDESYREDVELARASKRKPAELYRDIRAAAESGWDFSSRWLADGKTLASIETTSIAPVDLNALLFGLEQAIASGCEQVKDAGCVSEFTRRAQQRRAAMDRYLWDAKRGGYLDYHWKKKQRLQKLSAASLYPLFTGATSAQQARAVAKTARAKLLAKGGLATTLAHTGQQWDAPNGWAPLQWIAVSGLRRHGENELADEIAKRWLDSVNILFKARGKLVEKYDVDTQAPGSGGEYPTQDGFGWTNGVTRALMQTQGEKEHAKHE